MLVMVLIMVVASQALTKLIPIPTPIFSMDDVALIAALLLVAIAVGTATRWRCPACSRSLWRWYRPIYCPRCGTRLKD
jgi:hypothetical protein